MKGILLAGGRGSRLYPSTLLVNKQLLPVYDKPLVYYPLSVLLLAGIRDILIISNPEALPRFRDLLGNGGQLGIRVTYAAQTSPRGIADALLVGAEFAGHEPVCLILGDNIFYGHGLPDVLAQGVRRVEESGGATVFGYHVHDPQRYGVVEFSEDGSVLSIEEKPSEPKSSYAITGLYLYDNQASSIARTLEPSARGELEITDLNHVYLERSQLSVELLGRGFVWLDTGTHDSLLESSNFVAAIERRQARKIGCIEEVAFRRGFIDKVQLKALARELGASSYSSYLESVAEEGHAV